MAIDKETLRKQIYDEIHAQFESKLKDAKKQKAQLEEELEAASEKWRSERRKLNAEVDRLESALADARDARRKTPADTKPGRAGEAPAAAKPSASSASSASSSDEKLKKAQSEWTEERTKLKAEIDRLQAGVAELLERANNPMRATQAAKNQMETKLEEALRTKRQAEDALLAAKNEWDQEKLKLAGEMVKLRRAAGQTKGPKEEAAEEARIKELQKQLEQAVRARDEASANLDKAKADAARLKETHASDVDALKAQLEKSRFAMKALEGRIEETKNAADTERAEQAKKEAALERSLEKARKELEALDRSHKADLAGVTVQLEDAQAKILHLEERLKKEAEAMKDAAADASAHELEKARKDLEALEKSRKAELAGVTVQLEDAQATILHLEEKLKVAKVGVDPDVLDQLRRQYDERMEEIVREKNAISEHLSEASSLLESERSRFAAATSAAASANAQSPSGAEPAVAAAPNGSAAAGAQSGSIAPEAIDAEVARIEEMIAGIVRLIDDPTTELTTVIKKNVERAELDAYLKGILFSVGRSRGI